MNVDEKEISLKNLLQTLKSWINYLLSKWLLIGIVTILGAVLGILYAYFSKPKYSASLSFVLSANSISNGSIMGLASQFGIDLSSGSDDVFTGENIMALMKSRKMVQQALFAKTVDSSETLLNLFAKEKKLDEAWAKNERTKNAFPFPENAEKMTMIQDSLFREIYNSVTTDMLDVSKPDKNQSIYAITTISENETFSYLLTKYLVSATSAFYIDTKTSAAKRNLTMLQKEADSLRNSLGGAITSAGSQTDETFNLNPAYQVQRSGAQQSQVRASALGTAYGEVLKNLEIAKITLLKETPLYQIIDEPTLPLKIIKPSKTICGIIGIFLSGLMVCGFLIVRKNYQESK